MDNSQIDYKELDEKMMVAELNRRILAREKGVCDYCGKTHDEVTCAHPLRHTWKIQTLKHTRTIIGVMGVILLVFISGCCSDCRYPFAASDTSQNGTESLYGPNWTNAPHCHNGVCE